MTRCAFVIPGDIDLPTGGYAYDRRVLALLPGQGIETLHVRIPGSFPAPTAAHLAQAEAALAALPPDCVLLFDGLAFGALPAALVDRIAQPIVALCHHPLALETGLAPARAAELRALERGALARARGVVVTSAATRDTLVAEFAVPSERIAVALPGTDPAARAPAWQGGPVTMLAVGSVIPRKGYDVLVEALASLRRSTDSVAWQLRIAGSLSLAPDTVAGLTAQIARHGLERRISLLGAVDNAALDRLYAEAHLFVLPSHYEGYGMVLAEAMARGLPIVCTTGVAAAQAMPGEVGLKVAPADVASLRFALQRLLTQPALLADLGAASYRAGLGLPQWQDTARIIADVVRRAGR